MLFRIAATVVIVCAAALPQARLSVEQIKSFVKSSVQLGHQDKNIADYLRKVHLAERLEQNVVEELMLAGAGPKTMEALQELQRASAKLPAPVPPKPKVAPPPIPAPGEAEQRQIIEEVREYALNYTKRLPDFICTQVTRRYVDPSGLEFWQRQDVITARLSYFEQKEDYKVVLVNSQPTELAMDQVGGATSTGEFGSMLREIFEPATETRFQWERWGTLRGRRTHVFSYRVPKAKSKWHINWQRQLEIVPGYAGLIYVDKDAPLVARITLEAENIPPSFPMQQVSTILDYDFINIAGNDYVLPLRAVIRSREGKFLFKNDVEFRLYRKFSAEALISFETPDPLPEEKTTEQPVKPPPQ